jgi:hypothetical protein
MKGRLCFASHEIGDALWAVALRMRFVRLQMENIARLPPRLMRMKSIPKPCSALP